MRSFWLLVVFELVIYFSNLFLLFCTAEVSREIYPENAVINETGTAIFRCVIVENGTHIPVGWSLNLNESSITLNDGESVSGIGSVRIDENNAKLTLSNVCRSVNGGTITCTGAGSKQHHVFSNITVQYPPEYTPVESVPDPLALGKSVHVVFHVCGNPTPQNAKLTKDGDSISSNCTRVAYSVNEVNITDLQCDDSGRYTLQSSNAAGVGSENFMLNITSTSAIIRNDAVIPVVVQSTETDVSLVGVVNGCPDTINITCSLAGDILFTAFVDVSENSTETNPSRLKRSQFVSDSVSEAGNITLCCTASNAVGNTSRDVTVRYGEYESSLMESCGVGCKVAAAVFGCIVTVFFVWAGIVVTICIYFHIRCRQ